MNRRSNFTTGPRRGVTLVEMLVAAAMCVLIMWLLAWCYQQGLDSFRNVRAQGDLMAREQMAVSILLRDLSEPHFVREDGRPDSDRLRGQRLDRITIANGKATGYTPSRAGYFWARSLPVGVPSAGNVINIDEGPDPDGLRSSRSTNHALQFTTILPGGAPHNVYTVSLAKNNNTLEQWSGRAAEIAYFLVPTGERTPGGWPLHNLHRRWRLTALDNDHALGYGPAFANLAATENPYEVMTTNPPPAPWTMWTMRHLTVPFQFDNRYRLPRDASNNPTALSVTSARFGEDILISNVTSFEVKFTGTPARDPTTNQPVVNWPATFAAGNTDWPYDNLPFNGEFDTFCGDRNLIPTWDNAANVAGPFPSHPTGNANGVMKPICLRAVMIRIRAWDSRTKQTRQTTLIQDL